MYFLSAESIRKCDTHAIQEKGIPGNVLMERAGYGAFRFLTRIACPRCTRALVVCGKGNNAGDGYVIARYLSQNGCHVELLQLSPPEELTGDALTNWKRVESTSVAVTISTTIDEAHTYLSLWHGDVIVDAILGTGIQGDVRGLFKDVILHVNAHEAPVLAVDVPSGMSCDTGKPCGCAVTARWTVTFAHPAKGMCTDEGRRLCGRIECRDIGIPQEFSSEMARRESAGLETFSAREIAARMPVRHDDDYKNTFGHILVVGGSKRMAGAAVLCGRAALAAGAGLVTLAVPARIADRVGAQLPSAMISPLPDEGRGCLGSAARDMLNREASRCDVLAVGPGLGREKETSKTVQSLLRESHKPAVIDADALYAVADDLSLLEERASVGTILTPHPGEFARLTCAEAPGTSCEERHAAATAFAAAHPCCLVLKGHHTISACDTRSVITMTGTVAMATAGAGDVLTGVAAALMGGGTDAWTAAVVAPWLHGCAGDIAEGHLGSDGVTSADICTYLPHACNYVRTAGTAGV